MNSRVLPATLCAICAFAPAFAQDARQIVAESQKRAHSQSQRYEGDLEVVGGTRKIARKHWIYERLGDFGASKAILRFTEPPEVKGVALLVVNHPDRASDQWMWTPAIGRDRRIALQDRSTRFFGTDFSFEDLEERDVDQFDFRLLGEETFDGQPCWKIESRPKQTKSSQYTHAIVWVRKDHFVPIKYENFQKDQLIRSLHQTEVEKVQNIWTPRRLEMTDLRRHSRTIMKLEKLEYNLPLNPDQFTVQALRRQE